MGRKTTGVYAGEDGTWQVDKWWKGTRFRQRGFRSHEEAESWLIRQLESKRTQALHGVRPDRTFEEAATHYLLSNQEKPSIVTETYLLKSLMPHIGALNLPQIHDGSLAPYVSARLAAGRKHKTVNLGLGLVRHILNLAATTWRDETGQTWLESAPHITLLPLNGHQREPRPITWPEQRRLLQVLPSHLARMALFKLNTGVRDDVVCSLRWDWEVRVPELGISVFVVPREHVKGRKQARVLVCNSVAQSIIETVRGQHEEFVFVYRRERIKNIDDAPLMEYRPIQAMNNTAWQSGRSKAGLGDLHVHDLRHTVGMRLREAAIPESTIADILWHSRPSMTHHYTVAQVVEIHAALEKIKDDTGRWNISLAMLQREQRGASGDASPPKVPQQRKTG
ncbi:MAG: tyrosine-type recombinase/integrase [Roseateles sp.]